MTVIQNESSWMNPVPAEGTNWYIIWADSRLTCWFTLNSSETNDFSHNLHSECIGRCNAASHFLVSNSSRYVTEASHPSRVWCQAYCTHINKDVYHKWHPFLIKERFCKGGTSRGQEAKSFFPTASWILICGSQATAYGRSPPCLQKTCHMPPEIQRTRHALVKLVYLVQRQGGVYGKMIT